ncbi:MAG: hypothetical protein V4479_09910 [Actinomycetota bacterium]
MRDKRPGKKAAKATDGNVVDAALTTDAEDRRKGKYGVVGAAIAIVFGLFFAYDLFEAISNVIEVVGGVNHTNSISKLLGLPLASIPWVVLIVDVLVPPVVYALAFVIGRRVGALSKAAIFLIALSVVAAISLGLEGPFARLFS